MNNIRSETLVQTAISDYDTFKQEQKVKSWNICESKTSV